MLEQIDHVNIVVEDIGRMADFYRDVLGLSVTRQITIGGDWIDATTGLDGVEARVVYLEAESGPALELIQYVSPRGLSPDGLGKPNTRGLRHLAFRVVDLEALVASIEAAGVEFVSGIQRVPTAQVEFGSRQKQIAYLRDPEGNLLELCDYQ